MRIGVDIGGTFTDFTVISDDGHVRVHKTPTTPQAPELGIFNGVRELAEAAGQTLAEFLAGVERFIHGTTIATNTVITGTGPKLGLLTTEGFRDILYLRDGHKERRYELHLPPPEPLVPRHLRLPVTERVLFSGEIETPLDEASVRAAAATFKKHGVEAVAVSLLWSIVNPSHERRVGELLQEEMPSAYVALSSEVLPALREYPRTCATVLSAYVGPVLGRYVTQVSDFLHDNGYRYELLIMQATGGSAGVSAIEKRPVLAIGSGPAAAPPAALWVGEQESETNLMVVDMGGTSFDVSVITDGEFTMSRELKVKDMPIGVAAVDVHSVGAGGGSIAWIDSGGMLRVGPQSAGAEPGPACYGRGGEEPTVTDANVLLGYLNPDYFLGGKMRLDPSRAERAMERIAAPLELGVVEAAAAVYEVVNTEMVGAMRAVSVMRGVDPRTYTVIVGGGAGGTHAAKIAEQLGMGQAICPAVAGGLCSFGMLASDVRNSYLATYPTSTATMDAADVDALFAELEEQAIFDLESQGFTRAEITLIRSADAKYPYQLHELIVPMPSGRIDAQAVPLIAGAFHDAHERLYSYALRDMPVDLNGWRITAIGALPAPPRPVLASGGTDAAPALRTTRSVFFKELGGFTDTAVYDGLLLRPGMLVHGPAVVELPTTTAVVFPTHTLSVNTTGGFHIAIAPEAGRRERGVDMVAAHGR
jgi:N-methylhydantoinase A